MSTYRACALADRVMLIHDMPDRIVVSELCADQADLLLQQLEIAVRRSIAALRGKAQDRAAREVGAREEAALAERPLLPSPS